MDKQKLTYNDILTTVIDKIPDDILKETLTGMLDVFEKQGLCADDVNAGAKM